MLICLSGILATLLVTRPVSSFSSTLLRFDAFGPGGVLGSSSVGRTCRDGDEDDDLTFAEDEDNIFLGRGEGKISRTEETLPEGRRSSDDPLGRDEEATANEVDATLVAALGILDLACKGADKAALYEKLR